MEEALFSTAFIIQLVGHRMGDYLFQTDYQAQNKAKSGIARYKHCFVYALTIGLMMGFAFKWQMMLAVFGLTFIEHYIIDSRKPIVWWKKTLEKVVGNKGFDIEKMPFFVLIEIDQTVHYVRIFVISMLIGYGIL